MILSCVCVSFVVFFLVKLIFSKCNIDISNFFVVSGSLFNCTIVIKLITKEYSHMSTPVLIISTGIELDRVDEFGLTPLIWACAYGQLITVKYLLDMKVRLDTVGPHGENALLYASCYGYTDILDHLLQLGMAVDYVDEVTLRGFTVNILNFSISNIQGKMIHRKTCFFSQCIA